MLCGLYTHGMDTSLNSYILLFIFSKFRIYFIFLSNKIFRTQNMRSFFYFEKFFLTAQWTTLKDNDINYDYI